MMIKGDAVPKHRQLRQVVVDRIRGQILEGQLLPGEWIRQEKIAKEMEVSQMPVREALRELAAEGLVEHEPYRGVRVAPFTADDVADLYACRAYIEGLAARSAAIHITQKDLSELRQLAEGMEKRLEPALIKEYRELNKRFHTIVFMASRRPFLVRTLQQMWSAFPTMLLGVFSETESASLPDRDLEDVAEHAAILDALERHDADAAERSVRAHIEEAARHLVATLRHRSPHEETKPKKIRGRNDRPRDHFT